MRQRHTTQEEDEEEEEEERRRATASKNNRKSTESSFLFSSSLLTLILLLDSLLPLPCLALPCPFASLLFSTLTGRQKIEKTLRTSITIPSPHVAVITQCLAMKQYSAVMRDTTNGPTLRYDSQNVGCISSIFRMFDFRRTPKLISYLSYSDKHAVTDANAKRKTNEGLHHYVDSTNKNAREARPGMHSVKTLMEEEMAKLIPASMIPRKSCQNKILEDKTQVKLERKFNKKIEKSNRPISPQSPESFDFRNQMDCYDSDLCLSEFNSREIYPKKKEKSNCNSRDSNSIVMECLDGLNQSEVYQIEVNKRSRNHSFWEIDKSKNNQAYSRIVILKPSLSRMNSPLEGIDNERRLHQFSLTEIKSRLRRTIIESRKERDLISVQPDVLHNAYEMDSVGETGDTKMDSLGGKVAQRESDFFSYEMAKMHLIQRVDNLGKNNFKIGRERKSLSSLFSLPDFDSLSSPICTPRKEDDVALMDDVSDLRSLEPLDEEYNAEILNRHVGHMRTEDGFIATLREVDIHGDVDDTQARERASLGECVDVSEILQLEKFDSLQLSGEDDIFKSDDRSVDMPVQSPVLGSPDISENKVEDSCPALLHEEVMLDNTVSSTQTTKHEEQPIQRTRIQFKEFDILSFLNPTYETQILDDKETRSEFVSVVVKASGLCRGDSERWRADDPLLDSFLYDEIGISYDYSDDSKYLFDLIEEVLNNIRDKFVVSLPWIWSINKRVQFVPVGEELIQQVCKGVDLHLKHRFPCTLDQIIANDLEYQSWMDTRPDIEVVVFDIGDDILDDLLEEGIFDLWFS